MDKILFCASTASHIRNFHLPYMKAFRQRGYEVWAATNEVEEIPFTNQVVAFPFKKSILSYYNILAIFKLRKLLIKERFDKVSANTALASVLIRLAILLMPKTTRPQVYYVAHGFLFHGSDGLKKWIYLLPEIICTPVTNVLMVMNQEDWEIAKKYNLYKDKLCFVNGIGIDLSIFHPISPEQRKKGRQTLGYSNEDFLFVYAAEFSKRKNQESLIRTFKKAASQLPYAHLLLAGTGALLGQCIALVKELHMEDRIHLLGYVEDMENLYPLCDAAVSSSKIEGLPFNIMEAMACGLPVLVSDIKGHRDLVENRREFLFRTEEELLEKLVNIVVSSEKYVNWSHILEKCSLEYVMPKVFEQYMKSNN